MFSVSTDINTGVRFNAVLDLVFEDGEVTEPVLLAEAKAYAKIDTTADDTIITDLITTARQQCEDFTGISIIPRTITAILNNTCGGIFLPYGPVKTFTSMTDKDGNAIASTDYTLSGTTWPQIITPKYERLKVVYTTGYITLPKEIKTAILQQVFYLYENRGESAFISRSGIVADTTLSPQAKSTLQRLRRVG